MKKVLYKISRPLITVLIKILYRPKIVGKENIPKKGSVIIASNHTNDRDALLLISTTKREIHFLAKHTLFQGPKKYLFKAMGAIPVDRTKPKNDEALKESRTILAGGEVLGIFPEGTINRTPKDLLPFKLGAVSLAAKTDSYIVPCAITGQYKLFKNDLEITFGLPYRIIEKDLLKQNDILMNKVSALKTKGVER